MEIKKPNQELKGKAGYFNGNAKLEIPFFTNNALAQFTISMWFKTDALVDSGLLNNGDCADSSSIQIRSASDGSVGAGLRTTSTSNILAFDGIQVRGN